MSGIKTSCITFLLLLIGNLQGMGQIKIIKNGNVGIGQTTPMSKLEVQGAVRFGNLASKGQYWEQVLLDYENMWSTPTFYCNTDANFSIGKSNKMLYGLWGYNFHAARYFVETDSQKMKNIQALGFTLKRLTQIESKSYSLKTNSEQKITDKVSSKVDYGFVAQDLIKIFPDLVKKPDSLSQFYSVDYVGMIPVLVEAIKEQQNQIESLQNQIDARKKIKFGRDLDKMPAKVDSESSANEKLTDSIGRLEQTELGSSKMDILIHYFLSKRVSQAVILVCDLQGTLKKSLPIAETGQGCVTIHSSDILAGMYYYTLVADGKEIDSKKMIVLE